MATTTPTVWKAQFQVNPSESTDLPQGDVALADLGNGQFVAVYNGLTSVSPVICDAEGNVLQYLPSIKGPNEGFDDPVVASLGGGGFVAVVAVTGSANAQSIRAVMYDAALNPTRIEIAKPSTENLASDDGVSGPSVAVREDGSFVVTYIRLRDGDGTYDVVAKSVVDGQPSDEVIIYNSGETVQTSAEVAALDGGNSVIVYQNNYDGSDSDPMIRIVGSDLHKIYENIVDLGGDKATDVQVAALEGDRFVVVWATNDDGSGAGIKGRVFFNNGAPVGNVFTVNNETAGDEITPDVASLKDGGFVVTWDEAGSGKGISAQRFDASGDRVGSQFQAGNAGTNPVQPAVAGLDDGRVIIAFNTASSFDVFATIFDPREKSIDGTVDDDVLTSRADGATVRGLDGADTLLGQAAADTLDGGKGNDRIKGGLGKDLLTGGTQKDTFVFDFPVSSKSVSKAHKDKVLDFSHKDDTIEFAADEFSLLAAGKLKAKDFGSGTAAASGDKHLVYWNEKNGKLYYDANGSAQKGKGDIEIAKFNKDADIDAGDILIA